MKKAPWMIGVALGMLSACQPSGDRQAGGGAPPPAAAAPGAAEDAPRDGGDLALSLHAQGATAMAQRVATAYEARAREALKKGDLRTAYTAYKRLVAYRPNDATLALILERLAATIGARAIGALSDAEIAELDMVLPALKEADAPRAHVYRTAEANIMARSGRVDEAIVAYRAVLDNQPDYVPAMENLALAWSRQGKHDKAIDSLRKAIALDPERASLHNSLGAVLVATDDLDGAADEFRKATQSPEATALAWLNLGEVQTRQKDADAARKSYERATQLDPTSWEAFERFGSALLAKEEWEGANEALSRAYKLRPSGDTAYKVGTALLGAKRLDEALDVFGRLLKENPDVPDVLVRVGEIQEAKGDAQNAIAAYRRALQMIANNKDAAQAANAIAARINALEGRAPSGPAGGGTPGPAGVPGGGTATEGAAGASGQPGQPARRMAIDMADPAGEGAPGGAPGPGEPPPAADH